MLARAPRANGSSASEPRAGDPRHRARRSPGVLRRPPGDHPRARPPGRRGAPLRRRLLGRAADAPLPHQPAHRPAAAPPRPAQQRRRRPPLRHRHPRHPARRRRLPHRRLRRRLRARPPLRPEAGLRGLRRRDRARPQRRPHPGSRAAGARGGRPRARLAGDRGRRRARSSSGSTSTTPTRPTLRRPPGPRAIPAAPTTARSRAWTSRWGASWSRCAAGGSTAAPSSRWRPTTARGWASTAS